VAGFEPAASCSQSRRDTGLRYTPNFLPERAANVMRKLIFANYSLNYAVLILDPINAQNITGKELMQYVLFLK
jgi:hypothetical protein